MRPGRMPLRPLIAPAALCAIAVGFAGRIAWRAAELDPLPRARVSSPAVIAEAVAQRTAAVDVTPAVELDPFRPDRQPPPERYPVPGDAPRPAEEAPTTPPNAVKLLGTVLSLDGSSFAMVEVGGAAPRVVRVGQTVGELTLKKIGQGKALFVSASGETVEFTVPKAGQ